MLKIIITILRKKVFDQYYCRQDRLFDKNAFYQKDIRQKNDSTTCVISTKNSPRSHSPSRDSTPFISLKCYKSLVKKLVLIKKF